MSKGYSENVPRFNRNCDEKWAHPSAFCCHYHRKTQVRNQFFALISRAKGHQTSGNSFLVILDETYHIAPLTMKWTVDSSCTI